MSLLSVLKLFKFGKMRIFGTLLTGWFVKIIILVHLYSLFYRTYLQVNVKWWWQLCGVFGNAGTWSYDSSKMRPVCRWLNRQPTFLKIGEQPTSFDPIVPINLYTHRFGLKDMRKTFGRNQHLAGTNATLMHPSPLLLIELGWVYVLWMMMVLSSLQEQNGLPLFVM